MVNWISSLFVRIVLGQVESGGKYIRWTGFGGVTLSHIVQTPLRLSLTNQIKPVCFLRADGRTE